MAETEGVARPERPASRESWLVSADNGILNRPKSLGRFFQYLLKHQAGFTSGRLLLPKSGNEAWARLEAVITLPQGKRVAFERDSGITLTCHGGKPS